MILFLTYPIMKQRNKTPPPASWPGIERLSRKIVDPKSYLQGRTVLHPVLPTNIICFVRRRAEMLEMGRFRSRDQHHRFVLIVAVRGAGRVCIDVESFALHEGQAQLVFPFQFHSYQSVQPSRICWTFITFEMEKGTGLEALRSSPSRRLGRKEAALFGEIIRSWNAGDPSGLLQHQLALLLVHLKNQSIAPLSRRNPPRERTDDSILTLVNRHIMTRLDQPLVLKAMAKALGQSESHLRRRFRLSTGLSLGRYLRELRLQRACGLLHDPARTVGEVAAQCGFDSIYAFSRAFKIGMNVSPRAYRRDLK